jgi:hypothetical protein
MKGVLVRFADTHTFVYKDGSRECKSGNFQNWTRDVPLYYVKHSQGAQLGTHRQSYTGHGFSSCSRRNVQVSPSSFNGGDYDASNDQCRLPSA